jgi:UDP-glucose 4-epimerase
VPSHLITGGAGFIGSHLVDALLARGDRVVALDDLSTGSLRNLEGIPRHDTFRFVRGSVLDEVLVDELVSKSDVVVHLAAAVGVRLVLARPLHSLTTEIRGFESVIQAAHRHRRRVVVASTSEVYARRPSR